MEASPEDGSSIVYKQEEPDSSERDAESPDDGQALLQMMTNGDSYSRRESTEEEEIYVKEEPLEEEGASLSPVNSETDRQSGSGGEDRDPNRINRRKRKVPVKYQVAPNEDLSIAMGIPPKKPAVSYEALSNNFTNSNLTSQKQFAVMTKERARNQAINSMPRSTCPICGDKANGLHYGIYTCEACKNFFKRSVAIDASKAYVCKFHNVCNVNITEVDGVKMKGPRCQACRYQACLDAGMYHSGIQRTRGGRHGYSPVKQRSNSVEKYPTIQLPNISAVMSAAVASTTYTKATTASEDQNLEPADIVSVSMSPPSSDHNETETQTSDVSPNNQQPPSFLSKNQIWEQFVSENVQNEVDLLKSRANIAENLLSEKTKQLDIVQKQVSMLKQHLLQADQLNKEQAITIESLKRRLSHNGNRVNGSNSNSATIERVPTTSNGKNDSSSVRLPMGFENGGVTITPVVSSASSSPLTSTALSISKSEQQNFTPTPGSQNLLSHLLRDGVGNNGNAHHQHLNKMDMATIEPIRESRNKS